MPGSRSAKVAKASFTGHIGLKTIKCRLFLLLLLPHLLLSITFLSAMPAKASRSLRKAFGFRLSKDERSKEKDDGHRRDSQVPPPIAPATLFKSAAGSSMTDAGISQTAIADPVSTTIELQSQKTASSPNILASSVQEPATTPSAEYPSPATATNSFGSGGNFCSERIRCSNHTRATLGPSLRRPQKR